MIVYHAVKCRTAMLLPYLLLFCLAVQAVSADDGDDRVFHNHFAVKVDNATSRAVDEMASKHGFRNLGQIGTLEGYYLFEHERISKRSADPSVFHHGKLANEPGVSWVEQQFEQRRFKRDHGAGESKASNRTQRQIPGTEFPDPFYAEQWYLHGQDPRFVGFDMNVMPAWRKGYTGKGVVVSILDDGIQTNHPDLAQNYDPLASTDINGNDSDPMPRDDGDNKHGTRCAGEVAAVAFNSFCGVGIAYNAKIGGVRMLDGTVNDAVEASALSLNPNHIDIYSASWGPEDDGKTVDGPGPLAKRAFINGIMKGRKGKGSIFIWASGNGGRHEDSCNCDGYTNSIFTLSISSATQAGFKPWYLEECSSTLATTYSSGRPDVDRSIATVDMDGQMRKDFLCTSDHTGTSASAPLAAGICALALEANPNLTWRDMQHLVVFTSRPDPLRDTNWVTNGIGKKVSHKFGYGLMDAAAMVTTAEQWTNVPPQHVCQTPVDATERQIQNGFNQKLEVLVDTDACMGTPHEIRFLEHIQCRISLRFSPRGNLRIRLTSPKGTPTVLLFERPRDVLSSSFDDWPFMSVHFWGEPAAGRWKLEIINAGNKRVALPGILKKWQLVFYGTDTNPVRLTSTRLSDPPARPPLAASTAVTTGRQGFGRPAAPPAPLATPRPQQAVRPQQRFPFFFTPSAAQGSFRPSLFGSTRSTSFLGLASEQVTYVAPPDATPTATAPTPADRRSACPKYSIHGVCSETCPEAGYYAASSRRCEPCHAACSSCYGPGPDHCLRCADNFNAMVDKNLCAESCPESYHFEAATRSCVPCQAECVECDERLRCTRCQFRFILNDGRCHSTCPAGRYETDDYGCAECHPMCAECRGPGADQCVACASGTIQHLGHCLDRCPSASWHDPLQNQCLPCPLGCATCERGDSGADLVCTECAASWRLDASSRLCLNPSTNTCPQGEYAEEGKCRQCHGSCRECAGGAGEANCTRCPDGAWLDVEGRCRDACPAGTFAGDAESPASPARCRPCVAACAACQSSDRCTECVPGLHRQDGRCLTVCNEGYYSDRGVCVRCDASCASCSGPLATDCLRCTPGYALLQRHCLADCPVGTFNASAASVAPAADVEALADPHLCLVCQAQCLSCHGRSDRCLSCADGFAFNNKSCVSVSSLIEVPLVEFVKTAEGRGSRTGKDLSQHYVTAPTSGSYYWAVGLVAGVVGALIAVLAVFQAKSGPQQQRYTLVPLKRDQETGAGKVLLSPSDLDDEDDADGSVSTYKV